MVTVGSGTFREDNLESELDEARAHATQSTAVLYRAADKSLARPTSRCILFDGENICFDASLVIYINSTNIPPIMIINRIYETQNLLSLQLVSFLVGLRTYQHFCMYKGADKSLARPTSRCILFDGENISFDASLVIYIYIYIYK
jgi:hypothetical protein